MGPTIWIFYALMKLWSYIFITYGSIPYFAQVIAFFVPCFEGQREEASCLSTFISVGSHICMVCAQVLFQSKTHNLSFLKGVRSQIYLSALKTMLWSSYKRIHHNCYSTFTIGPIKIKLKPLLLPTSQFPPSLKEIFNSLEAFPHGLKMKTQTLKAEKRENSNYR